MTTPIATPTAQDVFNTVCDHLMKQGHKSALSGAFLPICRYRAVDPDTGETLKCAGVGILIPDDVYSEAMEGKSLCTLVIDPKWGARFTHLAPHVDLINTLQLIHDMEDVGDWPFSLKFEARLHGLELPASVKEKL